MKHWNFRKACNATRGSAPVAGLDAVDGGHGVDGRRRRRPRPVVQGAPHQQPLLMEHPDEGAVAVGREAEAGGAQDAGRTRVVALPRSRTGSQNDNAIRIFVKFSGEFFF